MTTPDALLRELQSRTARLGYATQYGTDEERQEARRDRTAALLEYQIAKALAGEPALTPEQVERACEVLRQHATKTP